MKQKTVSMWMKGILLGLGLSGIVFYFFALPLIGHGATEMFPEYASVYWPWMIFIWLTGVPCFAFLPVGWSIASNIARGKAFSLQNAKLLSTVGFLAAGDAVFFLIGNVVFLFFNINHIGIVLGSVLVSFLAFSVAVAAMALSSLTRNASDIREENELTI